MLRVLVVGGYGTFGSRLIRLLAEDRAMHLTVAGRSLGKAQAFCAGLQARAQLEPIGFDRDGDLPAQLAVNKPDVVVDASGPFQSYGTDPYRLVRACVATKVCYLDLADASAFVAGIAQFDVDARRAGVFVLSGASTFPALSSAVIRHLARDMTVHEIAGGVAPSPFAGIGRNVIAAIASYAGKRVGSGFGLTDARRFVIAPPACLPLRPRLFAPVDVPDVVLAPAQWPDARVWMSAGTAPPLLFRCLTAFAWLVRLRILPSLSPFAQLFHWVSNHVAWGEHRGGMFVRVSGNQPREGAVTRVWHMVAEGDDGPFVPAIAGYAILRRCASGEMPKSGARPCVQEVELAEFEAVFDRLRIVTGTREQKTTDARMALYRRLFGAAYETLPQPIREMHDGVKSWRAEGRAIVERGRWPIARLAAVMFGFPKAGNNVPVSVRFDAANGRETWTRSFAGKSFASVQFEGRGRFAGLMCERFGPLTFAMALVVKDGVVHLIQRGWSAFGIPLPMFLAPAGRTFESAEDGRFHFHVEIGFPWTGLIVRYRGWLSRS